MMLKSKWNIIIRRMPWLALAAPVTAASHIAMGVVGANLLTQNVISAKRLFNDGGNFAVARVLPAGPGGAKTIQIDVLRQPAHPWQAQYYVPLVQGLHVGDKLTMSFKFRSVQAGHSARIVAELQNTHPPWWQFFDKSAVATGHWKKVRETFSIWKDVHHADVGLYFNLGVQRQKVQITDVKLTCTSYVSMRLNFGSTWIKAAEARIKKYRMAPLTIEVSDRQGHAIANASVHVKMLRHEFQFGTAVAAPLIVQKSANARRYRKTLLKYYNHVEIENGLKWIDWHILSMRAQTIKAVEWLRAHHLKIRGHNLVWPDWIYMPAYVVKTMKSDPVRLKQAVTRHVVTETQAMAGKVDCWDVVNEPLDTHVLQDFFGNDIFVNAYKLAHKGDPGAVLYINENGIVSNKGLDIVKQNRYAGLIRFLLKHGAPLGGIGVQCHFGIDLTPPQRVIAILNRFAKFGKPLTVTELDINLTNRKIQAAYMHDFLIAAYSVPAVVGINQWGFWAGSDWLPQASLWNKKWHLRPVGKAYIDLVYHTWWTDKRGQTNVQGQWLVDGFLGNYQVSVTAEGKTLRVPTVLSRPGKILKITIP